ncbi:MAG: ABC transporter ATP-binding protein [Planctomycetes bacterium]|nr:ABC transporter ATP-binding protein [Planctomycetota bacterium]
MKNFIRALRFAWPYRTRLGISFVCALFAAALWSLNFTAIYPILKIFGTGQNGQNLQSWVDTAIDKCQKDHIDPAKAKMDEFHAEMEQLRLRKDLTDHVRARNERQLNGRMVAVEADLKSGRDELYRYQIAKRFIDNNCPTDRFETLFAVLMIVVIAVAVRGMFEFWQESLVGGAVNQALFALRNRFFCRTIHLDVNNFGENGTHELMSRFTLDIDTLGGGMKTIFGKVVAEPLKAIACITVAAWINWQLTLACLILVPFALLVLTRFGRVMKRATRHMLEGMTEIYKILQEVFQGIRIVKAFAREPRERRRFHKATRDCYNRAMWVVTLDAMTSPIIEVMTIIAVAVVFLIGAYIVLQQPTSILGIPIADPALESETLLQLYALLIAAADPVRRLSNVYTRIQSGMAGADRIFGYMDKEPKIQTNCDAPTLDRHHTDIEFRNVCFSYVPGQVLLEGIDLHIKQGEIVAFVGKNGCGKTSLLNLLPRFYDPDHGTIFIDGIDIRTVNLRSLRKQIAIVTQDMFLFDDTVFNNIAYAHPRATRDEVEAAARMAQAHDFIINDLDGGYDYMVGIDGKRLSGGQKQRICLARALLADPSILILDEFTNQNDPEAEIFLHRAIHEWRGGRTIFLITHRLHTLEIADRIVVLDEGRVAATGTHLELMQTCPIYQRLHEVQQQRLVA